MSFEFIDLFAGIGGMRIAFEAAGGRCAASVEWDKWARRAYEHNFGDVPLGDIRKVTEHDLPKHNVLVAGFPCQPFSIAGVSKKNSLARPHGFLDETQGTLFFEIERILRHHQPRAVVLENVGNLVHHDGGKTFSTILRHLNAAGYTTSWKLVSARPFVPQSRVRLIIVGLHEGPAFTFPDLAGDPSQYPRISEILDDAPDPKYTLSTKLWDYLRTYKEKHNRLGNGFGYGLVDPKRDHVARTLSARYYKDGAEILIKQPRRSPRRLTPEECKRLMGFPSWFEIVVSDAQAYKQFGNTVVVPLITEIAKALVPYLEAESERPQPQEVVPAAATRLVSRRAAALSLA